MGGIPENVSRIAWWVHRRLPMMDFEDAVSIAWESIWVHGDSPLAATVAYRSSVNLVRHENGRDQGVSRLRPQPVDFTEWSAPDRYDEPGYAAVEVACILDKLNDVEAFVLRETYLNDRTLKDVGREMGVTEGRVCQIRSAAVKKARSQFAT